MHKLLFAILVLIAMPAAADTCPGPGTTGQKDAVPLCAVVQQVTSALQRYQSGLGSGPDALPPLSRAEFDFKTTAVTTVGAKISLFVFTLGGSHEKDVTNDVTFIYAVPKPKPGLDSACRRRPWKTSCTPRFAGLRSRSRWRTQSAKCRSAAWR